MKETELQKLPQIEQLLNEPAISEWFPRIGRQLALNAVRESVSHYRQMLLKGGPYKSDKLFQLIDNQCKVLFKQRIRPVINASGIILHTNMGRSPLSAQVWDDCRSANIGYSNLELSLEDGKRGKRNGLLPFLVQELTGAEASLVVNNNAAAVFLALTSLAEGREVIVSRGEQVQIGGGFRIPEILKLSGATLVEVGTTNFTTADDYLDAVNEKTAMILKVHRSNFALRGFCEDARLADVTSKLPENVITVVDQGSGVINENLPGETQVGTFLNEGAELVTFSADKVLGGPQAGIIAGRKDLISKLEKHPIARTFRPGKTIYSLLESVLINRINSDNSRMPTFVTSIISGGSEDALKKCRKLKRGIPSDNYKIVPDSICIGGGSTPDVYFDSYSIQIWSEKMNPEKITGRLRDFEPPVIGTIKSDKVHLNPAAINTEQVKKLNSILMILGNEL